MKNFNKLVFLIPFLAIQSCKKEVETPKVIYDKNKKIEAVKAEKIDSSKIEIADLPIHFMGTKCLIHPIGDYRIYNSKASYSYGSSNAEQGSFKISNDDEFEITGFLSNFKFQQIDSDTLKTLTDKAVLIQTATYLKLLSDKTKQQILVYTLADMDTNKDNKLDTNDIKTLYISDINGNKFTKLSTDFEELIDWKFVEASSSLYFRSIEDTNKNGQFDKNDLVNYNKLNLLDKNWKVENYKPI